MAAGLSAYHSGLWTLNTSGIFMNSSDFSRNQFQVNCASFFSSFFWCNSHQWARASSFTRFLYHTHWHSTVGRSPLDEWSARRRDLYLTTHNTHNRQTSMSPVRYEPRISSGERSKTYALGRAATGTGKCAFFGRKNKIYLFYNQNLFQRT